MERAWDWTKEYGGTIQKQQRKLGCSCDWERSRFTMDEGLSQAVLEQFINLYKKGLIYKGNKNDKLVSMLSYIIIRCRS